MFYFGTHEIGRQKKSTLTPFAPYRDKYTLYRGACPKVLLEGVLEAEDNPGAKPDDTLSNLNSDSQVCDFHSCTVTLPLKKFKGRTIPP